MATLQTYIDTQKYKARYETRGYFVTWLNELLEELTERGFLPSIKKECGQIFDEHLWISKPEDLVTLREVYSPDNPKLKFRVVEVNEKFKLIDFLFDGDPSGDACSALSDYATTSITVNLTGHNADAFKNSLFVITAGTWAGRTYVLKGNDASEVSTTKLNFLHTLSTALDGTKATAGIVYPSTDYLMLVYDARLDSVSAASEEVPIAADFEKRIVPAWLRFKSEEDLSPLSEDTKYWKAIVEELLWRLEAGRSSKPINPTYGRRLIGYEEGSVQATTNNETFTETHG